MIAPEPGELAHDHAGATADDAGATAARGAQAITMGSSGAVGGKGEAAATLPRRRS
jgi:hypothetical protein